MRKWQKLFALVMVLAISLMAFGSALGEEASTEETAKRTKLTAAVMSFESLNAYKAMGHVIIQVGKPIYEPLMCEYEGEIVGVIAKTITKVDDYTLDVEIYDYVYDQAGNHITADDVVFSFETMKASSMWAIKNRC